jgi:hypothetical protein
LARKLIVEIVGDAAPLSRSLNGASRNVKEFEGHVGRAGRGALSASGAFSHLGRSIAFASGAFLGAAGFTTVVRQSISAASDLHEQMNKSDVVFGRSSRSVKEFAKTTATSFGIAEHEALGMASTFGNLLHPMGIARGQASKMSVTMVKLAADMASFNNADPTDVLKAIQSGISGQARPLRQFGVFLSEDRIKAEALSSGLVKANVSMRAVGEAQQAVAIATAKVAEARKKYGENTTQVASAELTLQRAEDQLHKAVGGTAVTLTDAQKAMARYQVIMKDTKDAQGDFARTSGGLANQQRILKAQIQDLEAKLGTALMPTVLHITKAMTDWLGKTENQQKVQRDLNTVISTAGSVLKALKGIVDTMSPSVKFLNSALGGTKHTLELLIGLGVAAKLRAMAMAFGLTSGGLAAEATLATGRVGLLRKALGGLPGKILISIIMIPSIAGSEKKFFEDHFGANFSGVQPDVQGTGGNPYPKGTPNHDLWELGKKGKDVPRSLGSKSNRAYQEGAAASGAATVGALAGNARVQGATGLITPGLKSLESAVGGKVNDDFATSGHATNSYHYKGQAADLAVDKGVWNKLYANRRMFAELFGPWGLYHYGTQFYDKKLQSEHMDHIHVAYTGGPQQISKMLAGGGGGGTGGGGTGGGTGGSTGGLTVGTTPTKGTWKGATEATIIAAKASVTSMLTAANTVIGGMAGPMDAIEKAAEAHLKTLREHLHPHMSAADLARTKADIAKWGKVLNDEIAAQTKAAKRAFDLAAKTMLRAFDKETAAGLAARAAPDETPTEKLLRQRQESQDDAQRQQALADAQAAGDAQAIAAALYDIETAALEKQAAAERKAADEKAAKDQEDYQNARDDQRQALQDQLDDWNEWLGKKMKTWNQFWAWVKANPNGGGVVPNIGETATAPSFGSSPTSGGKGGYTQVTTNNKAGFTQVSGSSGLGGNIVPHFAKGGVVGGRLGAPMLAVVHGGETVVPRGQTTGDIVVHSVIELDGRTLYESWKRQAARDTFRNITTGVR